MKKRFSKQYKYLKPTIESLIKNFEVDGTMLYNGGRNTVKYFDLPELSVNIKSFKIPNVLNKRIYRYFRKSKARRSFEYGQRLLQLGIGTPDPIAYFEVFNALGITNSYYCSKHLSNSFTLRHAIDVADFPDGENIIRAYTRLIFDMHEKKIYFKDNSAGNFLVEKQPNGYAFFLVDLNRMAFGKELDLQQRMANFTRITSNDNVTHIINDEYAKLMGKSPEATLLLLEAEKSAYWNAIHRKRAFKKKWKQLTSFFKKNKH
jgi:hypothetical protein